MRHTLFVLLALLPFNQAKADCPSAWKDGNGITWTMAVTVRTTYARAEAACKNVGYELPIGADFFEAVDFGLLDPKKNVAFGQQAKAIDWIWASTYPAPPLTFKNIVSREGDSTMVPGEERHWTLCILR